MLASFMDRCRYSQKKCKLWRKPYKRMKEKLEFFICIVWNWDLSASNNPRDKSCCDTYLVKQILKTFLPCNGDWQWPWKTIFIKKEFQDLLYFNDFLKPITLQIPIEAINRWLIFRRFVPGIMPSITQVFLQGFWALSAGF